MARRNFKKEFPKKLQSGMKRVTDAMSREGEIPVEPSQFPLAVGGTNLFSGGSIDDKLTFNLRRSDG